MAPAPGAVVGPDPVTPAEPGEARAGVVRPGPDGEVALVGGINAEGASDDSEPHDTQVQFITQRPVRVDVGGHVIDADLVRPDGQLGRERLEDQFPSFGMSRVVMRNQAVPSALFVENGSSDQMQGLRLARQFVRPG